MKRDSFSLQREHMLNCQQPAACAAELPWLQPMALMDPVDCGSSVSLAELRVEE